jgi:hypothetical protein
LCFQCFLNLKEILDDSCVSSKSIASIFLIVSSNFQVKVSTKPFQKAVFGFSTYKSYFKSSIGFCTNLISHLIVDCLYLSIIKILSILLDFFHSLLILIQNIVSSTIDLSGINLYQINGGLDFHLCFLSFSIMNHSISQSSLRSVASNLTVFLNLLFFSVIFTILEISIVFIFSIVFISFFHLEFIQTISTTTL